MPILIPYITIRFEKHRYSKSNSLKWAKILPAHIKLGKLLGKKMREQTLHIHLLSAHVTLLVLHLQ